MLCVDSRRLINWEWMLLEKKTSSVEQALFLLGNRICLPTGCAQPHHRKLASLYEYTDANLYQIERAGTTRDIWPPLFMYQHPCPSHLTSVDGDIRGVEQTGQVWHYISEATTILPPFAMTLTSFPCSITSHSLIGLAWPFSRQLSIGDMGWPLRHCIYPVVDQLSIHVSCIWPLSCHVLGDVHMWKFCVSRLASPLIF